MEQNVNYTEHLPQQQGTPLLNSSTCSHDAVVLDLTHGFLSGVDREGRNIKSASKQADIETKIKKKKRIL